MVAIRSSLLFWTSIILIGCSASLIVTSDTPKNKPVLARQTPTKKDPINEIAQKIYELKQPTEKDQEELETFLKEKESLLNKRPQCQRELKLIAEDLEGRRKVAIFKKSSVSDLLKKTMAQAAVFQKMRQQEKQTPVVDVSGPGITAVRDQIAQKEEKKQEPVTSATTQPLEGAPEKGGVHGLFDLEEEKEETVPTPESIREETPRIEEPIKTPTEYPFTQEGELITKEEEKAESTTPTPSDVTQEELVLALPSSFEEKIVQPLQIVAEKEPEKKNIITTTLTNVADTLLEFKLEYQEKIIFATNNVIRTIEQMATPEQKSLSISENIVPLLQKTETAIVPITNFAQLLTKTGIQYAKKAEGINFSDLNYFLYEATRNANLASPDYQKIISALTNTVTTITEKLIIESPVVTTALALQSTPESDTALLTLFNMLLSNFDALLLGAKIRTYTGGDALAKKLNDYRTTLWGLKWTQTQPTTIVPQLLALYVILKTVGPELIYAIEVFIKKYETVMPPEIINTWKSGTYIIGEYLNEDRKVLHKKDYTNELVVALSDLKEEIETGIQAISDKPTQKSLQDKLDTFAATPLTSQTKKTFADQRKNNVTKIPKKTTPTKQKPHLTKTPGTLGGIQGSFITRSRPKKSPVRTIKPIEEKKLEQLNQPLVPVAQVEPLEQPTPEPEVTISKQLTAYPVVNNALEELIKAVNTIDVTTSSMADAEKIASKLFEFDKTNLSQDQQARFKISNKSFTDKYKTIQNRDDKKERLKKLKNTLQEAIYNKELIKDKIISTMNVDKNNAKKILNESESDEYEKNFKNLLTDYAQVLVQIMRENSKDLGYLDLKTISECAHTLIAIHNSVQLSITQSTKDIMVQLCAFYDQALHMLYTPAEFNKVLTPEKEEAAPITLEDYAKLVDDIKDSFTSLTDTLTQLSTFIDKSDKETLEQNKWDISTLDQKFVENGTYRFAVAANTPVLIGDKTINTLQELNALHIKEYKQILEDWKNRIELDDTIQELKTFDVATSTPETHKDIQDKLATIAEKLPALLTSIPELKTLNEEITTLTETDTLSAKLTELLQQINTANTALKSPKETITKINFEETYKEAQEQITKLGDLGAALQTQLSSINTALNEYLTNIAQTHYIYLAGFPKRGYDGGTDLNTSITGITFPENFTAMLEQLKNLNLLTDIDSTTNPFNSLYQALLKNYGYILATFDAITAKLFDGAQNPRTWSEFVGLTTQKGKYESSIALLNGLLVPLAEKRSQYYQLLIEPYFSDAQAIKNYLNGTLSLMTLGLENITNPQNNYLYARSASPTAPGLEKSLLTQAITGIHMLSKDLNATIVHGGDEHYKKVIDNYRFILDNALASERTALLEKQERERIDALQKQAITALDKILNIPFGEPSDALTLSGTPEYKNKFGTLYENFGDESIPNPYAYLNDIILNKNPKAKKAKLNYIDTFFKTLAQELKNTQALESLKELTTKNFNDEIKNKIKDIFGNSYALLDSIIAWPYNNLKKPNNTPERKKLIRTILASFYDNIPSIFESLEKFRPYLTSNEFAMGTYVRQTVTQTQQLLPGIKPFIPIIAKYPFVIDEPQSLFTLPTSARTQENTKKSLEGLRMLINELGDNVTTLTKIKPTPTGSKTNIQDLIASVKKDIPTTSIPQKQSPIITKTPVPVYTPPVQQQKPRAVKPTTASQKSSNTQKKPFESPDLGSIVEKPNL